MTEVYFVNIHILIIKNSKNETTFLNKYYYPRSLTFVRHDRIIIITLNFIQKDLIPFLESLVCAGNGYM